MKFLFVSIGAVSVLLLAGLLLLLNTGGNKSLSGEPLEFLCAAGMQPAVQKIIEDYQDEFGVEILANYAGSGRLFGQIKASNADLNELTGPYDLIMANIIHNTLVEMAPALAKLLSSNGILIMAGILKGEQAENITDIYCKNGLVRPLCTQYTGEV